jgi:hypothetical protein
VVAGWEDSGQAKGSAIQALEQVCSATKLLKAAVPPAQLTLQGLAEEQLVRACLGLTRTRIRRILARARAEREKVSEADIRSLAGAHKPPAPRGARATGGGDCQIRPALGLRGRGYRSRGSPRIIWIEPVSPAAASAKRPGKI